MPSKNWLDKVEKAAKKVAAGPDTTNHDPQYWAEWGNFLAEYIQLVDAKAVLELVAMARGAAAVFEERDDLKKDERFLRTEYVVQANDDERSRMWQDWATEAADMGRKWDHRVEWIQDSRGHACQVGEIGTYPIWVNFVWATVNKSLVVFWDATSQVVDYELCEKWMKVHFTKARDFTSRLENVIHEQTARRAKHAK